MSPGLQLATSRRDRQLIELLLVHARGDRRRAASLAIEHAAEFPEDSGTLADVAGWFDGRAGPTGRDPAG